VKRTGIIVIIVAIFISITGFAMADTGIWAQPETLGISTVTTIRTAGSMVSTTDFSLAISDSTPLDEIPPVEETGYYASTYTEHTLSNGLGAIAYTKLMDIDTANRNENQYNIEASKQVTFSGNGSSSMITNEEIFVDGIGPASNISYWTTCVFAPSFIGAYVPPFCNSARAGSSVDMREGSVTTSSNDRFIMVGGDPAVVLNHDIRVIDTTGKASAFITVHTLEDRSTNPLEEDIPEAYQSVSFNEITTVDGSIRTFVKTLHYESGTKR